VAAASKNMSQAAHRYFIVNKPYQMVSQFVSPEKVRLLSHLDFDFPNGTHAVGRLDNKSEGLLILTTNKRVTKLLFESETPHKRTYLIQAEKIMTEEKLEQLRQGVSIGIKGAQYFTQPCEVEVVEKPANLFGRLQEFKDYLPQTWVRITLTEGKFHQLRKMFAVVGHDCKRLIRTSIEDLQLGGLQPGEVMELEEDYFFQQLKIENDWVDFGIEESAPTHL
jgi:23S rRNA pseudouridine2457 synthase